MKLKYVINGENRNNISLIIKGLLNAQHNKCAYTQTQVHK